MGGDLHHLPRQAMTTTIVAQVRDTINSLRNVGWVEEATLLESDLFVAMDSLPELLMVRDDAERSWKQFEAQ